MTSTAENTDPQLIVISGLPGTGKTTIAQALATAIPAIHISSDALRSEMSLRGQYSRETKSSVYQQMLVVAKQHLEAGETTVLDATFSSESWRRDFNQMANSMGVAIYWIVIKADEDLIKKRTSVPRPQTEADFAVSQKIKNVWDPMVWPHLEILNNRLPLQTIVEMIRSYIHRQEEPES